MGTGDSPGQPQRLPSVEVESGQGSGRGQRFQGLLSDSGAFGQIRHRGERCVVTFGHDHLGEGADMGDRVQSQADPQLPRRGGAPFPRLGDGVPRPSGVDPFEIRGRLRPPDVDGQDRHPVPAGVGDERLRGVEAHRLAAQQSGGEGRVVVVFEPSGLIDEVREADGMRFGEPVVREGRDGREDRLGSVLGDPAGQGTCPELLREFGHPLLRPA